MTTINGSEFTDETGRVLLLRGVNLGGSTKVPTTPNGTTWNKQGFYDHRSVSFVGKPFPLEKADEHYARLKAWGLTFVRFLITWEAIEHAGPGKYDHAYLDYLTRVIEKAADHGITLFIDPHQDVWSRFTGGDGAPGWIFEKLGMDLTRFHQAGAAFLHQESGDPYPRMIWSSNYSRYACATLWTLFFGGNTFAPGTEIDGVPVQEYLQRHYFNAIRQVVERLKGFNHVIGYDTLNEPSPGYIGYPNLKKIAAPLVAQGPSPTMYQGMLLAAGYPQRVAYKSMLPWDLTRTRLANPEGVSIWKPGATPIWQQHGVWEVGSNGRPRLLKPDYFAVQNGRAVDFDRDHYLPFIQAYMHAVRTNQPEAVVFVSPPPGDLTRGEAQDYKLDGPNLVYAPHWYDGITLVLQRYFPWLGVNTHGKRIKLVLGRRRKRASFVEQVADHIQDGKRLLGSVPIVIGETGISYNMNAKRAYRNGDFSAQVQAMDDTMQALEANLVNFTLWNYTADNSNLRGDLWNDEDLSIFSRDQQEDPEDIHSGGRALQAVVRPYAARIPGKPLRMRFDVPTRRFEFEFEFDPEIHAPLEIFVPNYQYPRGVEIEVTAGAVELDVEAQKMDYFPDSEFRSHRVTLRPK